MACSGEPAGGKSQLLLPCRDGQLGGSVLTDEIRWSGSASYSTMTLTPTGKITLFDCKYGPSLRSTSATVSGCVRVMSSRRQHMHLPTVSPKT